MTIFVSSFTHLMPDTSKTKVWDSLRRKEVALTPEEEVRQWFIGFMNRRMKIPMYKMMSEVSLNYGEGPVKKEFRADIVAYGRDSEPLMIVECKRPGIELGNTVAEQALRYNMILNVKYIAITNGNSTYIFSRQGKDRYIPVSSIPEYGEMLCGGEKQEG
ncbi:MAG: type I restriction enzyme HsdR N-terminal domain-containing protein [Candidatus Cryptobacteroides sp.]